MELFGAGPLGGVGIKVCSWPEGDSPAISDPMSGQLHAIGTLASRSVPLSRESRHVELDLVVASCAQENGLWQGLYQRRGRLRSPSFARVGVLNPSIMDFELILRTHFDKLLGTMAYNYVFFVGGWGARCWGGGLNED